MSETADSNTEVRYTRLYDPTEGQKMGESSWHELMQNLGGFLKVTDQLTNQSDRNV